MDIAVVEIGQAVSLVQAISESDVVHFAEVSHDRHPLHLDERYAKSTRFGRRIVHGALLIGYMSAAFTRYSQTWLAGRTSRLVISYGYDRIRFIAPTHIGDTVRLDYRIVAVDAATEKAFAEIRCTNQRGDLVAAATHILKFV